MTIIEKFVSFANGLPEDQRHSVEAALAALMESLSADYGFNPAEIAELDRRLAEPNPKYIDRAEVARIFGKPFSA